MSLGQKRIFPSLLILRNCLEISIKANYFNNVHFNSNSFRNNLNSQKEYQIHYRQIFRSMNSYSYTTTLMCLLIIEPLF